MTGPFITFLTDFGPDGPAAVCRGVMLGIAPDARIVDLAHGIRKYAIRDGAVLFASALPYFPVGVAVGVVDPGVGTERRPIAIRTGRGDRLVGPDNGLFLPVSDRLGGVQEVRVLENRDLWLPSATSSTFHGRDIFSPVAAHLATGVDFASVGPEIAPADLVPLPMPKPQVHEGWLETGIVFIDSFGNARLAGVPDDLAASVGPLEGGRRLTVEIGSAGATVDLTWQQTFGRVPVGAPLLYRDSSGTISMSDNQGSIAARLGLTVDQTVTIRAA
jgi:S-adenosyl-L-methionine hydrolase (adenosine-forming)